ncbi:MAG: hypothetical protein WCB46_12520 [Methanoregula sp.]
MSIIILAAAMLLKKAREVRFAEAGRAQRQRLAYQPSAKPIPVVRAAPIPGPFQRQLPAPSIADPWENCQDLRRCLLALAGKYSLDSFTIATSDGLVFASSGSSMAQEDAASYSRTCDGEKPEGVTLFSVNHKGSDLTGIIRSQGIITGETQIRIENDTKDILNRWI